MFQFLIDVQQYSFLQYALVTGLLASIACGVIGTYVIVRNISYIAGGISHTVLGGIGAALYFKRIEGLRRTGVPIRAASVMAETGRLSARVRAAPSDSSWLVSDWEDVEDWGTILVTFTDGTKAVLAGSDVQLGGLQSTLELCLSNARLICRLSPTNLCEAYAPHDAIFDGEYLLEKLESRAGRSYPAPDEQWAHGHLHMLEDCVQAVQTGRPPQSDGQLGRDVVEIIYAAYASAEEGRRIDLAPVGGT